MYFHLSVDQTELVTSVSSMVRGICAGPDLNSGNDRFSEALEEARKRGLFRYWCDDGFRECVADLFTTTQIVEQCAAQDSVNFSQVITNYYLCSSFARLSGDSNLSQMISSLIATHRAFDVALLWSDTGAPGSESCGNEICIEEALTLGRHPRWVLVPCKEAAFSGTTGLAFALIEVGAGVSIEEAPALPGRTDQVNVARIRIRKLLTNRDYGSRLRLDTDSEEILGMLAAERNLLFGATMLGLARASLNCALDYSRERKSFGKPLIQHQAVALKVADIAASIETAGLVLWEAALAQPVDPGQAESATRYCIDACVDAGLNSVQVLGARGYTEDYPIERWVRDINAIRRCCLVAP